jgi:hypothetical protein
MDPIPVFTDDVMCMTMWHNLVIIECKASWQLAHVDRLSQAYETILSKYPQAVSITIARPGTPLSNRAARMRAVALMKRLAGKIARAVVVVEETGPLAAMLRGVIRALNVIGGDFSLKVAASVEEGVRQLTSHVRTATGGAVTELQILGAIRRTREQFAPAATRQPK